MRYFELITHCVMREENKMAGFITEIRESQHRMREDVGAFWLKSGQARDNLQRAGKKSGQLVGEASRELWMALLQELQTLRELVTPHRFEQDLLLGLQSRLSGLEARIGSRIDEIGELTDAQPIEDYDRLSAKQIVAKLPKLDPEQRAAVVLYERTHKKRATILKAAS